jgi:hypothetical protein
MRYPHLEDGQGSKEGGISANQKLKELEDSGIAEKSSSDAATLVSSFERISMPQKSHSFDQESGVDGHGDGVNVYGFEDGSVKDIHLQRPYLDNDAFIPEEDKSKGRNAKRKAFKEATKQIFSSEKERAKQKWKHLFIPDINPE